MIRQCSIEDCTNIHDSRGYCKRHYKSFMKYGNAQQVDINIKARLDRKAKRAELEKHHDLTRRGTVRKLQSTDGICEVDGCEEPIKSKKLCEKHYARIRRTGKYETSNRFYDLDIETCLVIGCENKHLKNGYCSTHYSYSTRNKTPYIAKTIKLCGVKGCEKAHLAKGLCNTHYNQWVKVMKENGLDW